MHLNLKISGLYCRNQFNDLYITLLSHANDPTILNIFKNILPIFQDKSSK